MEIYGRGSWFQMPSALFDDPAPPARLVPPGAQAAPQMGRRFHFSTTRRELRDLLNPKGKEKLKIRNGKQARRRPAPPRAAPRSAASRHARRAGGPGSSEGSWLTAPVAHAPRSSRPR